MYYLLDSCISIYIICTVIPQKLTNAPSYFYMFYAWFEHCNFRESTLIQYGDDILFSSSSKKASAFDSALLQLASQGLRLWWTLLLRRNGALSRPWHQPRKPFCLLKNMNIIQLSLQIEMEGGTEDSLDFHTVYWALPVPKFVLTSPQTKENPQATFLQERRHR